MGVMGPCESLPCLFHEKAISSPLSKTYSSIFYISRSHQLVQINTKRRRFSIVENIDRVVALSTYNDLVFTMNYNKDNTICHVGCHLYNQENQTISEDKKMVDLRIVQKGEKIIIENSSKESQMVCGDDRVILVVHNVRKVLNLSGEDKYEASTKKRKKIKHSNAHSYPIVNRLMLISNDSKNKKILDVIYPSNPVIENAKPMILLKLLVIKTYSCSLLIFPNFEILIHAILLGKLRLVSTLSLSDRHGRIILASES